MVNLEVYDNQFNRLGVINAYSMVQYTNKFCDIGSFSLQCPITDENIDLLFGTKDRILWIEDDVAGIVQYNNRMYDEDSNTISVKGSLLSCITNWRYIYPQFCMKGYPDEVMCELVRAHLLTGTTRTIPNFEVLDTSLNLPTQIVYQQTGSYVGSECTAIGEANGLGYTVSFLPKQSKFLFKVLKGTDRTIGNTLGNYPVIFSREFNNIDSSEYTNNRENFRNAALIAGEGVGESRVVTTVEEAASIGFYRREIFVDARDIQSTPDDPQNQPLTTEEYEDALKQRGYESLQQYKEIESFESKLSNNLESMFVYGVDYFLGDTVTIVDKALKVSVSAVVTEVTVTYDEDGYVVEPTFGFSQPTLVNTLKKKGVL